MTYSQLRILLIVTLCGYLLTLFAALSRIDSLSKELASELHQKRICQRQLNQQ